MPIAYPITHRRKRYTPDDREAALELAQGICCRCGLPIEPGQIWQMLHVGRPHALGGEVVAPGHFHCHKVETATETIPMVAKTRRMRQKNNGSREPSYTMPCSVKSNWKAKIGGGKEPRLSLAEHERRRRAENPGLDYNTPPIMRQVRTEPV